MDSVLHGPATTVTQVQWSNGTSVTLTPAQNSSVKGVVYKTGSSLGNSNVLCSYARFGAGRVAALGDSSPVDDGSGDANDVLYADNISDKAGNHRKLLMNITIWLAGNSGAAGVHETNGSPICFHISPNPAGPACSIYSTDTGVDRYSCLIYSSTDELVETLQADQ